MRRNKGMKTNERVKETFYKMISLNICKEKRKEYIEGVYSCAGRLLSLPNELNSELDFLIKDNITSKEAVSKIEEMFKERTNNIINNNRHMGFSGY